MTPSDEAAGDAPARTVRLYDRRTLLQLSQSEHVHVPQGMASFEEWYGYVPRATDDRPWRPYTPRSHPPMMGGRRDGGADGGSAGAGTLFSRRDMPREGRGGRRALLDGAKSTSASATMAPGLRARNGGKLRTEKEADDGRTWRRVDDAAPRAASGMPAWMAEDAPAARPVGGVETIEAFKAQMREMERRERGEPALPVASAPSGKPKRSDEPEPETETETETSSRFARFFDTKSDSKATSQAPSSQNVGGLDLFGMFQTMQKREPPSMSAPESPAAPATHTAPGTPTAPVARPSAPAVRPTPPAGARPSPPSAPPAPLAAPPSEGPVDGLPKPSAADMASMQMLMAKLMGRPAATPESRGSPRPPASAPPEAPPGLGARPPGPPMGMYPRPMPGPAPPGAPMSQMDFLQSLLRTSAPGAAGAAGAPPPPPGLYPGQPPTWPQGPPYAGMPLHPGMPMPMMSAPPGLGGEAHGAGSGWRPPPGRPL